jgi:hypothetical protein
LTIDSEISPPLTIYDYSDTGEADAGFPDFQWLFASLQGQNFNPALECELNPSTSQLSCTATVADGAFYDVFGMYYQDLQPYGQDTHFYLEFGTKFGTDSVYSYPVYVAASCPVSLQKLW